MELAKNNMFELLTSSRKSKSVVKAHGVGGDDGWLDREKTATLLRCRQSYVALLAKRHRLTFRVVKSGQARRRYYRRDEVEALAAARSKNRRILGASSAVVAEEKLRKASSCDNDVLAAFGCRPPSKSLDVISGDSVAFLRRRLATYAQIPKSPSNRLKMALLRKFENMIEPSLVDLVETVYRIEQWAAWCRVRRPQCHCGSAEWRYRAPSDIDKTQPTRPSAALPDILAVDNAWRKLPPRNRFFLALHYVKKRPREKICRALAVRNHDDAWRDIHRKSVVMVRNRIMFVNKDFL